jgi:hypothetical protein
MSGAGVDRFLEAGPSTGYLHQHGTNAQTRPPNSTEAPPSPSPPSPSPPTLTRSSSSLLVPPCLRHNTTGFAGVQPPKSHTAPTPARPLHPRHRYQLTCEYRLRINHSEPWTVNMASAYMLVQSTYMHRSFYARSFHALQSDGHAIVPNSFKGDQRPTRG